jgi:hypothetical protein
MTPPEGQTSCDYYVARDNHIPVYVFSDMGIWVVYPDGGVREIVSKKWLKKLGEMR